MFPADPPARSPPRFARSFVQLQEAFELSHVSTAAEVFDRRFLPPLAERRFTQK